MASVEIPEPPAGVSTSLRVNLGVHPQTEEQHAECLRWLVALPIKNDPAPVVKAYGRSVWVERDGGDQTEASVCVFTPYEVAPNWVHAERVTEERLASILGEGSAGA